MLQPLLLAVFIWPGSLRGTEKIVSVLTILAAHGIVYKVRQEM